ncbi:MAG: hypothetical protein ACLQJL_00905 [Roseiarcus sp.]
MTWASAEAAGQAPPPIQAAGDAPPPQGQRAVFVADAAVGADLLDITEALQPIVELCCHRETQTPLTIGVVGPPGSGKSFALERLIAAAEGLAAAAAATPGGPFVSPLAIVSIDAAGVAGDPGSAIAAAVFAALGRERSGVNYAALADEAAHAGVDPYQAANKALERHDEARRRLDAERQARDDVEARRARLIENMLYETAGSRIDAYARARRGPIEARLRRFDLVVGDSSANFKDLVRDLAGAGWSARVGVVLGALWAYRSQRRLLLAGLALIAVGFGLAEAQGPRALDWLRGLGPPFVAMADGAAAHAGLISNIVAALSGLGVIALAVNLWRALQFTAMLFRGAGLLGYDVRERQRDLDTASARLNRRIAALTAETEAAARQAEAAEKRANARGQATPARGPSPPFMESAPAGPSAARAFLAALGRLMGAPAERGAAAPSPASLRAVLGPQVSPSVDPPAAPAPALATPERLLLAFDNLDALAPAQALELIEAAHSLLGPRCVAALACDPAALAEAAGDANRLRSRLDKLLQLTFNVRLAGASNGPRLVARLLGGGAPRPLAPAADARQSRLSEPLSVGEATLLGALAPLAAGTPRGVKRYLNVYRVARLAKVRRPALALMLALGQSRDEEAVAAMDLLLTAQERVLADPPGPPTLAAAVRATRAASEEALSVAELIAARDVARRYQLLA